MDTNPVPDALPSTAPYLTLRGVEKGYADVPVLRGIDLDLPRGTITAITGPSGAGKTTLLMIMGTLMRPDRGEVRILGQDPAALRPRALAALRQRAIGLVFQAPRLLPELTALENAALPLLLHGIAPSRARAQAEQCLRAIARRGPAAVALVAHDPDTPPRCDRALALPNPQKPRPCPSP